MDKSSLGDRMKTYEAVPKIFLTRRTPCIIRLDGKAFHSYTKGFDKPFDNDLMCAMKETMRCLCENIQGCVLGYTQSDEITLVLCDYQKLDTAAWFDYNVQKMVSVSASLATFKFNQIMSTLLIDKCRLKDNPDEEDSFDLKRLEIMKKKINKGALFDSRVFSIPKEEVNNCLLWRQQDATRNSIQSLAQANFSHKELQGLSCNKLQDKLMVEKGINWNDLSTDKKRGSCCIRVERGWVIDNDIPIFSQNPNYVNSRIVFE